MRARAHRARRQVRPRHALRRMGTEEDEPRRRGDQPLHDARPRRRFREPASGDRPLRRRARVLHRADRAHPDRRHRAQDRARASPRARRPTSRRRAPSTNGSSTTPSAIRRRAAAASATSSRMLESGNLGGKCADLNALFVGLARSVGIPARDVYGIRVAPSKYGYKSLGARLAEHHQGAALPRRILRRGLWLGAGRSGRRAQGRARGAAGQSRGQRREGGRGAQAPLRQLGNELARLQHAHDVKLPHATKAPNWPFLMYPQRRGRRRAARRARARQLQVHDHGARNYRRSALARGALRCSRLVLSRPALRGAQALERRPDAGARARGHDGQVHRLADYRGKVVLVNFWATWCEPCRAEMPSIDGLRSALDGKPFQVLAVNLAEPRLAHREILQHDAAPLPAAARSRRRGGEGLAGAPAAGELPHRARRPHPLRRLRRARLDQRAGAQSGGRAPQRRTSRTTPSSARRSAAGAKSGRLARSAFFSRR